MDKELDTMVFETFSPTVYNNDFRISIIPISERRKLLENDIMDYDFFNKQFSKLKEGIIDDDVIQMTENWKDVVDYYTEKYINESDRKIKNYYACIIEAYGHLMVFDLDNPNTVKTLRKEFIKCVVEKKVLNESTNIEEKFNIFDRHGNLRFKVNKDGDLVYDKNNLDLNREFDNLHRQLKIYRENENLEAIKKVLYQLKFILNLLNAVIYNKDVDRQSAEYKEAVTLKSFVQKDFDENLKFVMEREPKYNFNEEFQKSKYSDENVIISGKIISAVKELILKILMIK